MVSVWQRAILLTILSPGGPGKSNLKIVFFNSIPIQGGLWVGFPFLVTRFNELFDWNDYLISVWILQVVGIALILLGGYLYFRLLFAFVERGKGTPAPYDPPKV